MVRILHDAHRALTDGRFILQHIKDGERNSASQDVTLELCNRNVE